MIFFVIIDSVHFLIFFHFQMFLEAPEPGSLVVLGIVLSVFSFYFDCWVDTTIVSQAGKISTLF